MEATLEWAVEGWARGVDGLHHFILATGRSQCGRIAWCGTLQQTPFAGTVCRECNTVAPLEAA